MLKLWYLYYIIIPSTTLHILLMVHFRDRIGHLLPEGLSIDAAIGLFHVHAHKDDCFFRYTSTFIPGSGIVAGEILESLWSTLNSISPSARMSEKLLAGYNQALVVTMIVTLLHLRFRW